MPDFSLPLFAGSEWNICISHFLRHIYYGFSQSSKTLRSYRLILTQFFSHTNKLPSDITRVDVENFLHRPCRSQSNNGGSPSISTMNLRHCVLASFFSFASTFIVDGQPLLQKPSPTLGIRYGKAALNPRAMEKEQIARFFSAINQEAEHAPVRAARDKAIFITLLTTCRRISELCRMRYGDIEVCTFVENGKLRDGYRYGFTGKGHAGQRTYHELPGVAYMAIQDYLRESSRIKTIQLGDALFVAEGAPQGGGRQKPGAPLHSDSIAYAMRKYCRRAGIDERSFSIHSWRHTGVVQRLDLGQDMISIMRDVTDHSSLDSFYRYTLRLRGSADPGASAIDKAFGHL